MPGQGRPKLTKKDISLREMIELSYSVYGNEVDNKKSRANIDVKSAKITFRNNLELIDGRWTQTGRNIKITLLCETIPTSYKKNDDLLIHQYPVTFLIRNINEGIDSTFRFRSGSFAKWRFPTKKISEGRNTKEKDRIRKDNKRIRESNLRNKLDGHFFFYLMQVLDMYGLLYGPNTTNRDLPKKTNPKMIPYFDKHSLYCLEKIIIPILNNRELLNEESLTTND